MYNFLLISSVESASTKELYCQIDYLQRFDILVSEKFSSFKKPANCCIYRDLPAVA